VSEEPNYPQQVLEYEKDISTRDAIIDQQAKCVADLIAKLAEAEQKVSDAEWLLDGNSEWSIFVFMAPRDNDARLWEMIATAREAEEET